MKRILLVGILIAGASAFVMAQGRERCGRGAGPRTPGEEVSVTGPLSLSQGMIAIRQGETTYYLRRLERYVGFVDGFKEGAEVTINGTAFQGRGEGARQMLFPTTMVLNGKTYEVAPPRSDFGGGGRGRHSGRSGRS